MDAWFQEAFEPKTHSENISDRTTRLACLLGVAWETAMPVIEQRVHDLATANNDKIEASSRGRMLHSAAQIRSTDPYSIFSTVTPDCPAWSKTVARVQDRSMLSSSMSVICSIIALSSGHLMVPTPGQRWVSSAMPLSSCVYSSPNFSTSVSARADATGSTIAETLSQVWSMQSLGSASSQSP